MIWGDETDLQPDVAEAFSLSVPVELAGQRTPTPTPAPKPKRQTGRTTPAAPTPLLPLYQWQNGERLPNSDADMYRAILTKMVSARVDLSQDLFHTANGIGSALLTNLFRTYSFVLEDARGSKPATSSLRFDITRHQDDVRVLMAAKWFADHGHWHPEDGMWPFPDGYDPVELMLTLEQRLTAAEEVRQTFVNRVRGRDLVRAAIGVRAVALLAAGITTPSKLRHVNDVLNAKIRTSQAAPVWTTVDQLAREAVDKVAAAELIGQFAAVRQGDRGDPQLVDMVELEIGLKDVLRNPADHLRQVADTFIDVDATLALTARTLLAAVEKAAPALLSELVAATTLLEAGLDGHKPKVIASAAHDVGRLAHDSGLFRPADGWAAFEEAVDEAANLPTGLPLTWRGNGDRSDADAALLVQGWARAAIRGHRRSPCCAPTWPRPWWNAPATTRQPETSSCTARRCAPSSIWSAITSKS